MMSFNVPLKKHGPLCRRSPQRENEAFGHDEISDYGDPAIIS
jgi:hypothetical protein